MSTPPSSHQRPLSIVITLNILPLAAQLGLEEAWEEYRDLLLKEIDYRLQYGDVIVEGDFCDARMAVFKELTREYPVSQVYILIVGEQEQIKRIIRRSINRVRGDEPQGTLTETPDSVSRLIIKNIKNYAENVRQLETWAEELHCERASIRIEVINDRERAQAEHL